MNHLGGPSEGEVSEEPASGTVNESVEADLERPEVEEEQRYATRYPRHTNCSQGGLAGQEEEGMLARSASTESGFHNHTDTAEGDVIATVEDTYDTERVQENEDESAYAVQYRPESEEYTENAEAEHSEAVHHRTLPNHLHFHSIEHEEAMNAAYSGYVYTHRLLHSVTKSLCTVVRKVSQVEWIESNSTEVEMENFWMYQAEYRKKNSPSPDSSSPRGAESSSRQHHQDVCSTAEGSTNKESRKSLASFPTYVEVPGPCDPEDLIDGIIFAANYLGSTQLLSDKTPSKNVRMMQAQEAVSRIKMAQKLAKSRKKAPEGESQPMTEVDLFISTQRIKVLNADTQETMMDHPLRTISYIADIGNIVVLMARRRMPRSNSQDNVEASHPSQDGKRQYKMICHVFESEDAQLIAQSIGQAFSVAYQEFLRANGINPEDLSQKEYSDLLNTQDMYNDDLIHFSKSENCKDVYIEKQKGEILGVVIVESGWGSILPTVIIANMMHGGPAEKSGKLNIGDQIMSINGTSLVGLPLSTCQSIIKGLKNQARVKLNIVRCPPVTTVLIRRPDLRYQLGFSVQNGIICSLMRGGIAERGGVRVGHRIIEINGQSVVATPHEKIVHILSNAVGEIHMKTMPAAMYRLLTAQEQPVYI
ncbi:PREDICTED: amyloid beta A4 precursor protein-binding family A member 1 [Chaetura pelagica]|uniref:amyloid beta A4 precursor protein-binding family A member 1 n=1 Tax=Chaetura pelagica TaxID=8897 RepID=UPI000523B535|nr:PREDICTED: amyloid beta A4 precursor protein-binding family A member 1 [Chaetura pelagica]